MRQPDCLFNQTINALAAGCHGFGIGLIGAAVVAALTAVFPVPPGEYGRIGGAVQLGQGDEHCGFNGTKPLIRGRPLPECLEFQRVRREVGNVERFQHVDGGVIVIIGGPANKAETCQ